MRLASSAKITEEQVKLDFEEWKTTKTGRENQRQEAMRPGKSEALCEDIDSP